MGHPSVLLKIYIYGYLNRIQSSRRLEREVQRNVELMWLTGRLMPDFKTIANFRKDNSKAIRGVCRQFVVLCRQLGLFEENLVAIDGSKFKAVNNRDRNFTSAKLKRRMEEIESSISRYLAVPDAANRQEPTTTEPSTVRLEEKITRLKTQMKELQAIEIQLNESLDKQVSLTDPDARSMMTRGTGNRHEWTHNAVALFDFQRIGQTHHSRFDFISGQGRIAQQPPLFLLIAGVQPAEAGQSHARAGSLVDGLFLRPAIGQ